MQQWTTAADRALHALTTAFWDEKERFFQPVLPVDPAHNPCYWWQAHAIDALLDGYLRTGDPALLELAWKDLEGTVAKNNGTILNNWYDDMEWMALALLRLYDSTNDEAALKRVRILWKDIQSAWNDHCGGGMAWRKNQLDYKNTPANAPAAILALRLYRRFGDEADLAWGCKIYEWNRDYLMNPETYYVYDGMNREGDGKIDMDWRFTYNQGVMIGAAVELYQITGEQEYLNVACGIARQVRDTFLNENGVFPYEGKDDCGLFRGILMRYLVELARVAPEDVREMIRGMLEQNATMLAENGLRADGLIGGEWTSAPAEGQAVDLAQHLSGLMLLEMTLQAQKE